MSNVATLDLRRADSQGNASERARPPTIEVATSFSEADLELFIRQTASGNDRMRAALDLIHERDQLQRDMAAAGLVARARMSKS